MKSCSTHNNVEHDFIVNILNRVKQFITQNMEFEFLNYTVQSGTRMDPFVLSNLISILTAAIPFYSVSTSVQPLWNGSLPSNEEANEKWQCGGFEADQQYCLIMEAVCMTLMPLFASSNSRIMCVTRHVMPDLVSRDFDVTG